MKKFLFVVALIAVLATIAACAPAPTPVPPTAAPTVSQITPLPQLLRPSQPLRQQPRRPLAHHQAWHQPPHPLPRQSQPLRQLLLVPSP
mgnify:CR=1 FL=1